MFSIPNFNSKKTCSIFNFYPFFYIFSIHFKVGVGVCTGETKKKLKMAVETLLVKSSS